MPTIWSKITGSVHSANGKVFLQLWHVGRISHTSLLPNNLPPVAPSPLRARSQTFTESGLTDVSEPHTLTIDDIVHTIEDYRHASKLAKDAGFDGVEIHGANGYLIDQFLQDGANQRTDEYGSSIENMVRFLFEDIEDILGVWGDNRVGLRLSPSGIFNDMHDSDPLGHCSYIIEKLNAYNLAFFHMVERFPGEPCNEGAEELVRQPRQVWNGTYITNGN